MLIKTLVENTSISEDYSSEHGLSLYIETKKHKILFDVGASGLFILEHFHMLKGRMPNYMIGGFHLSSRSGGNEDFDTIDRIGKHLIGTKAKYYTCHCTGMGAYV
ncbi:hypothetical protein [Desulfitobacterium sp.]|uniref:hypothetical protein n=1 Tax=Desulfitobacterium sp. TaxID=49981 RepID=UPI002B214528|nr:hypothetical protein [Desulfitobacterium sp.]MEA4900884.1 hypothetical protein [Desulfitobacterium sp.]